MGFDVSQDSMIVFSPEWMTKYGVSRQWALLYYLFKAMTVFSLCFADWSWLCSRDGKDIKLGGYVAFC